MAEMKWNPTQYEKFAAVRQRPALELLARIPGEIATSIIDLGCGTGNIAPYLQSRWPGAQYTGVDASPDMLARARADHPGPDGAGPIWIEADIASWKPDAPADIIYSNAALQWLPNHDRLIPRLAGYLAPGGRLAIQMPISQDMPTHKLAAEIAGLPQFQGRIPPRQRGNVLPPDFYYDLLQNHMSETDIWETEYLQQLSGEDAVYEWARGTVLLPFLAALEHREQENFAGLYAERLRKTYPKQTNGITLFPFRRLFIVARK